MISDQDPHAVLGVARTATPDQISQAYRELLRRQRPATRNPDDDNAHDLALREVLNAYADLHYCVRGDADDPNPPTRHLPQPAEIGAEAGRPTPIYLLIAFLEALPQPR